MKIKNFFDSPPSDQNAIDIFEGQWSSRFPESMDLDTSGFAGLFEDERILWAQLALGEFKNRNILELGPLEGGHSFMLEKLGAATIDAFEANSEAYLRCLITKEICKLQRVNVHLGDFLLYLESTDRSYDVAIASGVLYHQSNPVELLKLLSKRCMSLFIWTHYYDAKHISQIECLQDKFAHTEQSSCDGFEHTLYHYEYGKALNWAGFCGAGYPSACWLSEEDIVNSLQHFGYSIRALKHEDNPNGPALWLACNKD